MKTDVETTLLIKTATDRVPALCEGIKALHPYALPEIVVLRVDGSASSKAYLDWVVAETQF